MCPLRYLYHVLLFLLSSFFVNSCVGWKATFNPNSTVIKTSEKQQIHLVLSDLEDDVLKNINNRDFVQIQSGNSELVDVQNAHEINFVELDRGKNSWQAEFFISGVFIGRSKIQVAVKRPSLQNQTQISADSLEVTVIRPNRVIDRLFIYSVIILMSILYINFGAAISMNNVKQILKRPIGPLICFFGQFLFMPLCSFALGSLLFRDNENPDFGHALALGLFFTGVSPGGGASNMWTILLGGNIDLSIAMTTISTIAAFAMMPLWIFTLGGVIFERAKLGVPYNRIASSAIGLLIPLAIGIAIKKFLPKTAKFLVRILKPLSFLLILFIVIFAIITNLYIFQLFSWQIIIAGLGLPWLGYTFGWITSKIFRQSTADSIAISVETGIQNTGISIFLLTFALEEYQPLGDLTTVVPVSVAIMTPFPLIGLYIFKRIRDLKAPKDLKSSPMIESDQPSSAY